MPTPILNFYKRKSVFITGGTGFLGKVLMEKLLYSCKNLDKVFMHVKPKFGKNTDDRMMQLLHSENYTPEKINSGKAADIASYTIKSSSNELPKVEDAHRHFFVFQRIRENNPKALRKIVPIAGNLLDTNLGISDKDILTLHNEVSIVFHVAANVSMSSVLKNAIDINTKGTEKIVNLCKGMNKLQSFVYVSSAYSNCPTRVIEEEVYNTGTSVQSVYNHLDTHDNYTAKILGKKPNAYTFSKALAEEIVAKAATANDLPAVIVRPSLIVSSVKEPAPGWADCWHGCNGFVICNGKGALRHLLGDSKIVQDLIPVDYVVNLCIASAWDLHMRREKGDKDFKVFNCSSGLQNPIKQADFFHTCLHHSKNYFKPVVPKPSLYITKNRLGYNFMSIFLETLPAFVIYFWESISGRKHKFCYISEDARKTALAGQYFLINEFTFIDDNTRKLHEKLDVNDAKNFDFDVKNINWNNFLKDYVLGLKKYVMKEK